VLTPVMLSLPENIRELVARWRGADVSENAQSVPETGEEDEGPKVSKKRRSRKDRALDEEPFAYPEAAE
jgi:hypothetical protein